MHLIIKIFTALFIVLSLHSDPVYACNGGCPSGGGYLGIVPQFSKNFIGLRYRFRSFEYQNTSGSDPASKHRFETAELWGRFYPHKKIQAFIFVPFQMNAEKSEASSYTKGVGDISFIFNYTVLNTGDSLERDWKHTLLLGVGAKLPTGKYQQRNISKQMYPVTFQPGTGAYSAIFSGMYTLRYTNIGWNTNISYYYNGNNELAYSFGNMLSANSSLFYWLKAGTVSFLPSLGTYIEQTERDIDNGYYVNSTGGMISYGTLGLDIYIKRLALGINIQKPYAQNLPQREQKNDLRLLTSAVWLF